MDAGMALAVNVTANVKDAAATKTTPAAASANKNYSKNGTSSKNGSEKKFDDVLKDVDNKTDEAIDTAVEKPEEILSSMNNSAVLVAITSLLQENAPVVENTVIETDVVPKNEGSTELFQNMLSAVEAEGKLQSNKQQTNNQQNNGQPVKAQPTIQVDSQPVKAQPTVQTNGQSVEAQPTVQTNSQPVEVQPTVQTNSQLVAKTQPAAQETKTIDDVAKLLGTEVMTGNTEADKAAAVKTLDFLSQRYEIPAEENIKQFTESVEQESGSLLNSMLKSTVSAKSKTVDTTLNNVQSDDNTVDEGKLFNSLLKSDKQGSAGNQSNLANADKQQSNTDSSFKTMMTQLNQQGNDDAFTQTIKTGSNEQPTGNNASVNNQQGSREQTFSQLFGLTSQIQQSNSLVTDKTAAAQQPQMADIYDVQEQIVEQARLVKTDGDTEMIIKLRPEHLGDLAMKISVNNGVVSASFHSDNPHVRGIIESSIMQLKQEMQEQGLKVDNIDVYSGGEDFMSNGQSGQANQQNNNSRGRRFNFADFDEDEKADEQIMTDEAVDYRI